MLDLSDDDFRRIYEPSSHGPSRTQRGENYPCRKCGKTPNIGDPMFLWTRRHGQHGPATVEVCESCHNRLSA